MKVAQTCQSLLALLQKEIRSGPLINIDETTIQVLDEPGRSGSTKSYMWICRGGPPEKPALMYNYTQTRSNKVAASLLDGYKGVVQSDGYAGYDFLDNHPDMVHAGCWAHARRKFKDARKGSNKKNRTGSVDKALSFIRRIYGVEHKGKKMEYSPEQMVQLRREETKPVLDDFLNWLGKKKAHTVPTSLLGTAVNYTLRQWDRLTAYLDYGDVTPDNNGAENCIRPFEVGRKNWLFSGTPQGAKASACLYSLIETAKINGLEPYHYLRNLFEKLVFAQTEDDYRNLLPQYLDPKDLKLGESVTGV